MVFGGVFFGGIQESYVSIFDIQGAGEDGKNFYESEEDEDEKEETEENEDEPKKKPYIMDSDHRLLLRQTKPLLNSRNAAVSLFQFLLVFHKHLLKAGQALSFNCKTCGFFYPPKK